MKNIALIGLVCVFALLPGCGSDLEVVVPESIAKEHPELSAWLKSGEVRLRGYESRYSRIQVDEINLIACRKYDIHATSIYKRTGRVRLTVYEGPTGHFSLGYCRKKHNLVNCG